MVSSFQSQLPLRFQLLDSNLPLSAGMLPMADGHLPSTVSTWAVTVGGWLQLAALSMHLSIQADRAKMRAPQTLCGDRIKVTVKVIWEVSLTVHFDFLLT